MTSYRHLRRRLLLLSLITVSAFAAFSYISSPPRMVNIWNQLTKQRLAWKPRIVKQQPADPKFWVLMAAVYSSPDETIMRKAVRETWGQYLSTASKSQLLFFISQSNDKSINDKLLEEERTYQDIARLDFIDSFKNQSLRSLRIFQWIVDKGIRVQFLLRADVKAFVNIPKMVDLVKGISAKRYMLGQVTEKTVPERDKKSAWYVSTDEYVEKEYPRYLQSYSYLMTGNLIETLLETDRLEKRFWIEDVYITGILAKKLNVAVIHTNHFTNSKPAKKCDYPKIIVCLCTPTYDAMKDFYAKVEMPDESCMI